VSARGDSFAYIVSRFVRRHRLAVGAAALLVLTLLAGIAGTTWQAIEARRQRADALAQRDRAQVLLARNEAIFDFFDIMMTESVPPGQAAVIQQMLERGAGFVDIASGGRPERQAEILRVLASYYADLDNPQKAAALLERARSLVPEASDRSLAAQLACTHASALSLLGKRQEAIDILDRWSADATIDDNVAASCLQSRAIIAQNDVDAKQVLHYVERALQRLRQSANPSAKIEASLLGDQGFALHLAGKNGAAEKHYEDALARLTQMGLRESKEARRIVLDWGIVEYGSGDFKRGLALYEEALRAAERLSGDGPISPAILGNYAFGLEGLARNEDALKAYDQTLAAADRNGFLAGQAYALIGKASVLTQMGDTAQAQRDLQRAAALMQGKVPESHPAQIRMTMVQARIDVTQGRLDNARRAFTRVIELLSQRNVSHPVMASALRQRAEIDAREGKRAEALADAQKAVQIAAGLQAGKPYSDDTGLAYLTLGRLLQASGDRERAHAALQSAVDHLTHSVGADHPDSRAAQGLLAQT
jgi:tetratricopeptide (TPR) repeat protein